MKEPIELTVEVKNAIRRCATEIIGMESRCIEWGVEAGKSVDLAEETITNLVKILSVSGSLEMVGK